MSLEPRKYRWITEGVIYTYYPAFGKGLGPRRGTGCLVITVPGSERGPGNVLVRFLDGLEVVVPAETLKKLRRAE